MTRKSTFFLLLFSIICINLSAQKVKLDDLDVRASYFRLPNIGFKEDITSYHVSVIGNEGELQYLDNNFEAIKSKINILNIPKVELAGTAEVALNLGTPRAENVIISTTETKDKEGKITKYYKYTFNVECEASYKVVTNTGTVLKEVTIKGTNTVFDRQDAIKYESSNYTDKASLEKFWYDNGRSIILNKRKEKLISVIDIINQQINDDFGLVKIVDKVEFNTLKEKSAEYAEFKPMEKVVIDAFYQMSEFDNSKYITAIQPAIDFWTSKLPTYNESDKEQEKLVYACRYNTALAYYWADDFANARKYASMVENGEEKSKDGKKLREKIEKLEENLKKINWTTRHRKVELSDTDTQRVSAQKEELNAAISSGDISKYPDFNTKMGVRIESKIKRGVVYNDSGRKTEGYFVFESNSNVPNFIYTDTYRFGYDDNGKIKTATLKFSGLDSFSIDTTMFKIRDITLSVGILSMTHKNAVYTVLKDFKRTQWLMYHPTAVPFGAEAKDMIPSALAYHKEKNEFLEDQDGFSSFTKKFSKFLDDCPEIGAELKAKKDSEPKKSLLNKMLADNTAKNEATILEYLPKYDDCELTKSKKK